MKNWLRMKRGGTISRFLLIIGLLGAGLLAGGVIYSRQYVRRYRGEVEARLSAVAIEKVCELQRWREERLGDAASFGMNAAFSALVRRHLDDPGDAEASRLLGSWLEACRKSYGYAGVFLLDARGIVRSAAPEASGRDASCFQKVALYCLDPGPAVFMDFHHDVLAVLAPVVDGEEGGRSLGIIVLEIDPADYLYPLINRWPTPSATAETLLVRREGNEVVFLSEPRFRADAPPKLRFPLEDSELPAARAALGEEGIVEGLDYRGVPVIADVRGVRGSPWFLVARMDVAEALAPLRRALWVIALFVGLLTLAAGAGVTVVWQRGARARYLALLETQRAHYEAEARYQATLMSVGDAVIATDVEGRVEMMNPVAVSLTGWELGEALGKPVEDVFRIVSEETRQPIENPVRRVVREGVVVGLANHTTLLARDGRETPIANSGAPIHDKGGAIAGVVLVFRDHAAEREAMRALEQKSANLQAVMHSSPVGMMVFDETGQVVLVNPAVDRLFPRSRREIERRRCGDFLACANRARDSSGCGGSADCPACPLLSAVRKVFASGRSVDTEEAEVLLESADGREARWLRFGAEPVVLDGRKQVLLTVDDVSARRRAEMDILRLLKQSDEDRRALLGVLEDSRRAEMALKESATFLRTLLEAIPVPVFHKDTEGRYVGFNRAFESFLGRPRQEMIGKTVFEIAPRELAEIYDAADQELFQKPGVQVYETKAQAAGGPLRDVVYHKATLTDHTGRITGLVGAILDITERKRNEEEREKFRTQLLQSQKLEAVGTLAGGVAHEINNPIMGIMNYAQLIIDTLGPDGAASEYAVEIGKETQRVSMIVRNLLSFARFDRQAASLARIHDIVEGTMSLIRTVMRRDQITLEVDLPAELPEFRCRSQQIQQVVMNLLTNARDALDEKYPGHHEDKKIIISGRVEEREEDGVAPLPGIPSSGTSRRWLRLTIEDHGTGIPEDVRERLFEPFFSTKPRDKGTGLGLSVSHGIVREHGGQMIVESDVGQWTRFHVDLPLAEAEDSEI